MLQHLVFNVGPNKSYLESSVNVGSGFPTPGKSWAYIRSSLLLMEPLPNTFAFTTGPRLSQICFALQR